MENMNVIEKIILGAMLLGSMFLLVAIYLLIRKYKKDKKEEKRIKEEIRMNTLHILTFQQGMKIILTFFPDPNEENPFEKKRRN